MNVPLIKPDLPTLDDVRAPFEEILSNGRITNFGKYVNQFEAETADYLAASTVAVSSGTAGLIFALTGLGLAPGEKVILPSFTFMATAQAILYAGGEPIFAEVEDDLNLSPTDLEQLLDRHPDVGAVMGVHVFGLPARAPELEAIVAAAARKRGRPIPLIFDAAHAFGASLDGRRAGSFGDAEVFSLSVTKVLVTVEGGLISTRHPDLIDRTRHMRNYGIQAKYNAHFPGLNGKMSEFHAIVGLHNLRRLDQLMAQRQAIGRAYADLVHQRTPFRLTAWPGNVVHALKDFTVLVPPQARDRRDEIIDFLASQGVECRAYFSPPVHEQDYFRKYADRPLPRTEDLARRVITLPFFTTITQAQIDYVVDQLVEAARRFVA